MTKTQHCLTNGKMSTAVLHGSNCVKLCCHILFYRLYDILCFRVSKVLEIAHYFTEDRLFERQNLRDFCYKRWCLLTQIQNKPKPEETTEKIIF